MVKPTSPPDKSRILDSRYTLLLEPDVNTPNCMPLSVPFASEVVRTSTSTLPPLRFGSTVSEIVVCVWSSGISTSSAFFSPMVRRPVVLFSSFSSVQSYCKPSASVFRFIVNVTGFRIPSVGSTSDILSAQSGSAE